MAEKVTIVDDFDENVVAEHRLSFFLDGQEFELDLGDENYEKYFKLLEEHREMLKLMAEYGRPVTRQAPLAAPRGRTKEQLNAIRVWARSNGHKVNDMGRIPENIIKAYENRAQLPTNTQETTGDSDGK